MNPTNSQQDNNVPNHIAIIMDGNRRWAKNKMLPKIRGHHYGAQAIKQAMEGCRDNGVKYLTLYAFSSENWNRSDAEVKGLMDLLRSYLDSELDNLHKNKVRLRIIGDRAALELDILEKINNAEELTKNNQEFTLIVALNYGSRQEIIYAVKNLLQDCEDEKKSQISLDQIDEKVFSSYLYTKDIPDPDLLIRTSGEKRISNFLLWQCAYTEFYYCDVLWPDFTKDDLEKAIFEFKQRDRRYGAS